MRTTDSQAPLGSGFGVILFAAELDRRASGDGIRAFSLHPGTIVDTNFKRNVPAGVLEATGMMDSRVPGSSTPTRAGRPSSRAPPRASGARSAAHLDGRGGRYAQDCDLAPVLDHTDPDVIARANSFGPPALGVMDDALDPGTASRLWSLSDRLTTAST